MNANHPFACTAATRFAAARHRHPVLDGMEGPSKKSLFGPELGDGLPRLAVQHGCTVLAPVTRGKREMGRNRPSSYLLFGNRAVIAATPPPAAPAADVILRQSQPTA